jgi:hypothetical protein
MRLLLPVAAFADIATTLVAVYGMGAIEMNPLAKIFPLPALMIAVMCCSVWLFAWWEVAPKLIQKVVMLATLFRLAAVVNNFYIIAIMRTA